MTTILLKLMGVSSKTKEEAMDIAGSRLIDTVMIEWEE